MIDLELMISLVGVLVMVSLANLIRNLFRKLR